MFHYILHKKVVVLAFFMNTFNSSNVHNDDSLIGKPKVKLKHNEEIRVTLWKHGVINIRNWRSKLKPRELAFNQDFSASLFPTRGV